MQNSSSSNEGLSTIISVMFDSLGGFLAIYFYFYCLVLLQDFWGFVEGTAVFLMQLGFAMLESGKVFAMLAVVSVVSRCCSTRNFEPRPVGL